MAQRILTMRKIKEILRLTWVMKFSNRQVAASVNIAHRTVGEYIKRAERAGLDWQQAEKLGEAELKKLLFPLKKAELEARPEPNWQQVEEEMQGKHVTRMLLWQEYIAEHPDGFGYSQFCDKYRNWLKAQKKPVMRIPKRAGEEVQVDYAGHTMSVIDPETGEVKKVQIFVGVLGASGLIYAEAHESQSSPNWIRSHVRMFDFFGGVPQIIRPDNLKAAVKKPSFYDPDLNPAYHELAAHYGTAVIPTRVAKPKDKGLGENAVLQAGRWIMAPLRNQRFFSLHELNQAIKEQLKWLNNRKRSDSDFSRRELFERREKAALQPLPIHKYDYLEIKYAKVHIDYHVSFEKHLYSVPHKYIKKPVLIRAKEHLIEIYYQNQRIACHVRARKGGFSTNNEHMPDNHRWRQDWSPERFRQWAREIGPHTEQLIMAVLASRRHPEQGYRACLGILNLVKKPKQYLLEAACEIALETGGCSYKAIKNILTTKKDVLEKSSQPEPISHEHIRGNEYYT